MPSLMDKLHRKEKEITVFLLGSNLIAGTVLFAAFILPRSEQENQLFLGLSTSRLFVAIIFLVLLLVNVGIFLINTLEFGDWQKELKNKIVSLLSGNRPVIMVTLYIVLILTGAFLLLCIPPIIRPLSFLESFTARLVSFIGWIFCSSLFSILLFRIAIPESSDDLRLVSRLNEILTLFGMFLIVFFLDAHFAALIGWINKTKYSFFDLLAEQFVHGKLYLENPPYTHDLTLYNGKWYVPMPPLPAILMMPLAYLIGGENISTSYLSMVFSAMNGILLYLILKQFNNRKWINLSTTGVIILLTLFLFGTPHFWLGISGRGWYFSQILTAFFLALSVYAALRSCPAWVVGSFVALAMLARPNALMSWPFAFGIAMQTLKERQGNVGWKQAFFWSLKTVPPIALAIGAQLTYNYLRFHNFFDFGYTTVNAGQDIVNNVHRYGLFSAHFIPTNLYVMLIRWPTIHWGVPWPSVLKGGVWPIDPTTVGMSIFFTTPPLIYLFRRYPKQWWVFGAWIAVLFNVAMLSLYSNTGAHQFGYRYVLDFILPLMILLAVGIGEKIPWHLIVMVLTSIIINLYGAYWFMNG